LPPAGPGVQLGTSAFQLALAPTDGGATMTQLPAPVQLSYRPDHGDLLLGSRMALGVWNGSAWVPLPCSVADDARVTCSTTQLGLFAVLVASPEPRPTEMDL